MGAPPLLYLRQDLRGVVKTRIEIEIGKLSKSVVGVADVSRRPAARAISSPFEVFAVASVGVAVCVTIGARVRVEITHLRVELKAGDGGE